jgi:hypothetical protein
MCKLWFSVNIRLKKNKKILMTNFLHPVRISEALLYIILQSSPLCNFLYPVISSLFCFTYYFRQHLFLTHHNLRTSFRLSYYFNIAENLNEACVFKLSRKLQIGYRTRKQPRRRKK